MQRPSVWVVVARHQSNTGLIQETAGGLVATRIPAKRTRMNQQLKYWRLVVTGKAISRPKDD
jgi:hypothetical protein